MRGEIYLTVSFGMSMSWERGKRMVYAKKKWLL